jgi:hypothetical protein
VLSAIHDVARSVLKPEAETEASGARAGFSAPSGRTTS